MTPEDAYNQLRGLVEKHGAFSDFEALDVLWIATGHADDLMAKRWLLDQHSKQIRRQQGRTEGG